MVTVLVHGFNVSANDAVGEFFPTYFKRLYWVGHPVLRNQGSQRSGYPHTVGISWPSDQGGSALFGIYFPEDEFHALQTGVPLSRLLKTVLKPSSHSIDIIAHSLGNLVVNSALMQPGMIGVVDRYIMNDAAVPADAFDAAYSYSHEERSALFPHAEAYGYGFPGSSQSPDDRWERDWHDMQQGRPFRLDGPADQRVEVPDFTDLQRWNSRMASELNPALFPKPSFTLRWRQERLTHEIPLTGEDATPRRGPWRGLFAGNIDRARILNAYNSTDQVLRIDGILSPSVDLHAWYACQLLQKPNVGLLGVENDSRTVQFWGLLAGTDAQQEYLWDFQHGTHANVIRQWAELAHWFPSVSGPAGSRPVGGLANEDMRSYGGDGGFSSHTYMGAAPFSTVWGAYAAYRAFLAR
jgi:hypothetical protein